jgi:radical SAM superfamily enzyme YgiQ (UPF0313 family)
MFWDFFCKVVPSLLPYNFIGISVISSQQLIPGLILARMIKENNPSCHIVMGGTYITLIKGKVKNFPFIWSIIDSIVAGDGEEPLYRLICSYYRQESCDTVPNLIYKELIYKDIVNSEILSKDIVNTYISNNYIVPQENNIIKENESSFHMSVKDLEIADYHDLELKRYFSLQKVLPVVANSGCYWGKCAFCCDTYFEQKVEFREAASLLTEIKYLKARYNCRYFDLISLALGPVQIKQVAELMLENQLDVKWQCWSRLDSNWSYDIFETLYRAGCRRISFGLETASPRVLKSMNKGIDITKAVQIIKDCNRANILVKLFFMTGFPTETEAEAWETFNFIKSNLSYIDSLHHSYFTLDEPSRMAKDIDKYGITLLASPDNLNFTKHFESTIGMSRADSFRVYNEIKKQLNTLFDSVKAEWEYFFEKNGETAETIPAELRPHDFVKMGRNYLAFKLKESSVLYDIMSDKFLEIAPSVYEVLEEAKEGIKADDIYAKLGKSLVRLLLQNEVLEVI